MMGGKIVLNKGVVPHKFECQGRLLPQNENRATLARKRKIREILQEKENIVGKLNSRQIFFFLIHKSEH